MASVASLGLECSSNTRSRPMTSSIDTLFRSRNISRETVAKDRRSGITCNIFFTTSASDMLSPRVRRLVASVVMRIPNSVTLLPFLKATMPNSRWSCCALASRARSSPIYSTLRCSTSRRGPSAEDPPSPNDRRGTHLRRGLRRCRCRRRPDTECLEIHLHHQSSFRIVSSSQHRPRDVRGQPLDDALDDARPGVPVVRAAAARATTAMC
jgi:hypothetical protein